MRSRRCFENPAFPVVDMGVSFLFLHQAGMMRRRASRKSSFEVSTGSGALFNAEAAEGTRRPQGRWCKWVEGEANQKILLARSAPVMPPMKREMPHPGEFLTPRPSRNCLSGLPR